MHAFVGDIARHLGLTLSLSVIQAGIERVKVSVYLVTTGMAMATFLPVQAILFANSHINKIFTKIN